MHETKDWRVRVPKCALGTVQVACGLTLRQAEALATELSETKYGKAGIETYANARTVYVVAPEGFR